MTTLPNDAIPLSVEIPPEVTMLLWNAQIAWNEKAGWFMSSEQSMAFPQPVHGPEIEQIKPDCTAPRTRRTNVKLLMPV